MERGARRGHFDRFVQRRKVLDGNAHCSSSHTRNQPLVIAGREVLDTNGPQLAI